MNRMQREPQNDELLLAVLYDVPKRKLPNCCQGAVKATETNEHINCNEGSFGRCIYNIVMKSIIYCQVPKASEYWDGEHKEFRYPCTPGELLYITEGLEFHRQE